MSQIEMSERKSAIEARYTHGAPWTKKDRTEWWAIRCAEMAREIARMKPDAAHGIVLSELAATSISHAMRRQEIEARLDAVEAHMTALTRLDAVEARVTALARVAKLDTVLAGRKPRVRVPVVSVRT